MSVDVVHPPPETCSKRPPKFMQTNRNEKEIKIGEYEKERVVLGNMRKDDGETRASLEMKKLSATEQTTLRVHFSGSTGNFAPPIKSDMSGSTPTDGTSPVHRHDRVNTDAFCYCYSHSHEASVGYTSSALSSE